MSNNTRKIVVLDRIDSPCIEQAIFILHDNVSINDWDALCEAEKIVNDYLYSQSSNERNHTSKRKRQAGFFFGMLLYTFATILLTSCLLTMIR